MLFGGQVIFGSAPATTNVWTHLALVRDGITTLYVNGVASISSITAPAVPAGSFGVGIPPNSHGTAVFQGSVDEVRMFTFAPGQFSTNDLLINTAPPTVSTSGATGVGPNSVTLNGRVNSNGFATTAWFEWGTTTNLGSGTISNNLTQVITGLTAGVTYYFRAVASIVWA